MNVYQNKKINVFWFVVTFSITLLIIIIPSSKALGYTCTGGRVCSSTGGCVPEEKWLFSYSDGSGRHCWKSWKYCSTSWNCTGSGSTGTCMDSPRFAWYDSLSNCVNNVNPSYSGCCVEPESEPCDECTPSNATCPAGTTSTATVDHHSKPSSCCNNSGSCDDDQSCDYIDCYCAICTPPACGPTYSTSDVGFGTIDLACRNGTPETPGRTTKCDETKNTCYCYDCLKNCPSPLLNQNSTNPDLKLEDFRRCTNDCIVGPDEANDDCYEVYSSQPTETFSIVDTEVEPNEYDFKDQIQSPYSHTGQYDASNFAKQGDLNDPTRPIEMIATYTDSDGASDIEGMFVWFRHEDITGPYGMPVHISSSTDAQGPAQNSWGFMLKRSGPDWLPYVTSFQPLTPVWTRVDYEHSPDIEEYAKFFLPAPDGSNMIEVTVISVPTVSADGKSITIKFSLRFTNDGNLFGTQKVQEGKYKILLMGLDKFSFTPFDNYVSEPLINDGDFWDKTYLLNGEDFTHYWSSDQLRYIEGVQNYARDWTDTGKTWILDFKDPEIIDFRKEIIGNSIKVSWNVSDDRNLYAIVGNIYVSGSDQKPLTLYTQTNGLTLRDDDSHTDGYQISPIRPDNDTTLIGKLNQDPNNSRTWSFRVAPDLSSASHTGSVTIGIGNNTIGEISVYLTVFDDAGNVITSYPALSEDLADRFLTGGGLAFSPDTYFAELPLSNTSVWTGILPPYVPISGGLIQKNAAFSSEMYANYKTLVNSSSTGSYGISSLTNWINSSSTSLYDSLKGKYELHKKYIEGDVYEHLLPSSISFLPSCTKTYCTYFRTQTPPNINLTINSGLICNKKALIFVKGNLTINPPLFNTASLSDSLSNSNGCIFVVGGNVNIRAGSNVADGTFEYDKVNAFIVSDGVITIEKDSLTPPYIVDGVYINGGLISKGGDESIDIRRTLRLQERLLYPVFAIDLHPKYGMLAEKFFGNSYVIQSTEVGLKPY